MKKMINFEDWKCIELEENEILDINGGISQKTMLIGNTLTFLCPVVGAGFWISYVINS
ncbi:hypothetical protein [Tannerella sp.]|uniref:hypothetical protein n=1 Tax=Tannerella sp. TaxID=2382127 RepID=UPI003FA2FB30